MKFFEDFSFREQFLKRESQAVNAFVSHFVTVLHKQAQYQGLSPEEADDVVQECFSVFFRKCHDIQENVKLSTFLFGIFQHSIQEARRRRGRFESTGDLEAVERMLMENYDEKGHWKPDVQVSSFELLEQKESQQELDDCIQALPEKYRQVVTLSLEEEEFGNDLCHILGLSYANFRKLLSRARQALRLCLENSVRE